MLESVNSRLNSDVPVGCFLSGGFDSTLITALASKISNKKLAAYTFSTGDEFDEASTASVNAKLLGLEHHIVKYDTRKLIDIVDDLATVNDQPFCDSSQIPTYIISHEASKNVKVMLGGDGADELFYGYNRHRFANHNALGSQLRPLIALLVLLKYQNGDKLLQKLQNSVLTKFTRDPNFFRKLIKLYRYFAFKENYKDYLGFLCDFRAGVNVLNENYRPVFFERVIKYHDIDDVRNLDFRVYLPGDILTKVDRASMRWGVEARSPFLNFSLLKYSNLEKTRMGNIKNPKNDIKELLRQVAPPVRISGVKKGFVAPARKWISHELYDWINDNLNTKKFLDHEIVNIKNVRGMLDDHRLKNYDYTDILWKVAMTASWVNSR